MEPISQNLFLTKIRTEKKNKAMKLAYVCVYVWEQEKMREKESRKSMDKLFLFVTLSFLQRKNYKG